MAAINSSGNTLQSAVRHSAGIMAVVTVIVRCSVCCSINLLLTTEAPFVTDMQFLYQQQHTAAKLSGWNSTDSRNLNVLGKKRNEGSGLQDVTLRYFSDVSKEPVLDSSTAGDENTLLFLNVGKR